MTRRSIMVSSCAGIGAAAGFFSARLIEYLGAAPDTPWKAFTPEEAAQVDALAEELIPADDMPGAHEARVVRFIDWQLAPGAPFARDLETYRRHLPLIKGKAAAEVEKEYRQFFDLVLRHVKMGYYGNPRYGGNAHHASYRLLGIAGPGCTGREVPAMTKEGV